MRDVGDEIAAHALEPSQFGDVVEHDDGTGRISGTNCGNGDGEIVLAQSAGYDFRLDARLAAEHLAHGFEQVRSGAPLLPGRCPDVGGTSSPRISAKPGLANTNRSALFTTATPSTMLPRIAEERLRSSVRV